MTSAVPSSAALPIAHVVLRILIVLNWVMAALILTLLLIMPNEQWIMSAFKLSPSLEAAQVVWGLRSVAILGLVAVPLNYGILKRLLAMVETVRAGDPFVATNAQRLQAIARRRAAFEATNGSPARTVSTIASSRFRIP